MKLKQLKATNLLKTERTFGVEIECFNVDRNQLREAMEQAGIAVSSYHFDAWRFKDDCSIEDNYGSSYDIDSVEVVSPILSGAEGLQEVYTVVQIIKNIGGQVNSSCGLHVHWGASDLNLNGFKNLVKGYVKNEDVIDQWIDSERRENDGYYCRSMIRGFYGTRQERINETFAQIDRARNLDELMAVYERDRYFKLNLLAYYSHGTVEVRHHDATLDADRVVNWIVFLGNFIEAAIAKKPRKVTQKWAETSFAKRFESLTRDLGLGRVKTFYRKQIERMNGDSIWSSCAA